MHISMSVCECWISVYTGSQLHMYVCSLCVHTYMCYVMCLYMGQTAYIPLSCVSVPISEASEAFLRLSAMLTAFTTKPTVIITSFRIVCLDSLVTLVKRYPFLSG